MADPERVRLLVVADWDVGFVLTAHTPLPDVAPGDAYVTEIFPQRSVTIREVLVEGFTLVQIAVGTRTSAAKVEEHGPRILYRLDAPLIVETGESVCIRLCNDSDAPRKQKSALLLKEETGRAEDAVPCPACRKRSGDSCDGPSSHPSRIALHARRE